MDDRAPRIDPTSRRGRKLIDATFRAIAKWRPACEWGTVVVQPNCAVRIGRLGDVSDRAPADQRTADGRRRESTVPSRKARSAPTRRTDRSNQRTALHLGGPKILPHPAAEARVSRPPQHVGARIDADYRECFIIIVAKDRYYYT